jgi:hypothetical protein
MIEEQILTWCAIISTVFLGYLAFKADKIVNQLAAIEALTRLQYNRGDH